MQHFGTIVSLFREQIDLEPQKALYDYWRSKYQSGVIPSRADVEPTEIPQLLKHVGLVDVLPGDDFRYRLVGTHMVNFFDKDFTGTLISQSKQGKYGIVLRDMYRQVREHKRALFSKSRFVYQDEKPIEMRRLVLPLSDNNNDINMLLFSTIALQTPLMLNPHLNVINDSIDFIEYKRTIEGKIEGRIVPQKKQKEAV
ncbi:MAG: PAS domain-containing protein [Sneathiella sp.]|nr:PAS domain-containing protein [Sneathiella sp.]